MWTTTTNKYFCKGFFCCCCYWLFWGSLMLLDQVQAASETITIDAATWTIPSNGGPLPPLTDVHVGDTLTFEWTGTHDVHKQPTPDCPSSTTRRKLSEGHDEHEHSDGAVLISSTSPASYVITAEDAGKTIYFTCLIAGHCEAGMVMAVTVADDDGNDDSHMGDPHNSSTGKSHAWTSIAVMLGTTTFTMMGSGLVVQWLF